MIKNKFLQMNYKWQQINKITIFLFLVFSLIFSFSFIFAHSEDAELNAEIQKGRELVEKFYRGEIKCQDLTDQDFHSVGEYVMEQMVGGSDHLTMNKIIEQMHGEEGEELMHINMGKRYLGCDSNNFQNRQFFMMPMHMWGQNMPMMGYWQGWWDLTNWRGWNILGPFLGILGTLWLLIILVFPILVLILLVLGIIYLIKKLKLEVKKE